MSKNILLDGKKGECHLLLGNEAIVRGALEAGVHVVTCYPGTPSSEVPDTFYKIGGNGTRYYMQYSVNEKVAMEVACGCAMGGARTLVTMKHVGLNVAADPLFTSAYTGLPGGLVVLSADDPGFHSSQNEQDNRNYARAASLPCFEPAGAQEACAMTREAFRVARELEQPVLLRTTTRVSHMRGAVTFGDLPEKDAVLEFRRDPMRFVPVPAVAKLRHKALEENMKRAQAMAEESPFNTVSRTEGCRLGVIVSGASRNYLADALMANGWQERVNVLELGMTWPLPEKLIAGFLASCDRVLVLEENDPLLENGVRTVAQKNALATRIEGKGGVLTIQGEYSTTLVTKAMAAFLGLPCPSVEIASVRPDLPKRPPNLCAGCSHRAVYYAAHQVFGEDAYYSSDIGCYTLGMLPPLRCADFLFCMGSSVSAGSGFSLVTGKPVVGFIGDSTFFHSGMTGLANALFNRMDIILVILDNGTTAMTGHQPNPGMLQDMLGERCAHLDIESIVRGMGVTQFRRVKSFNLKSVLAAFEEFKGMSGVRVMLSQEPCALYARRRLHKGMERYAVVARQDEAAKKCFETFACPAFCRRGGQYAVDETLCTGCGLCLQVAPGAFKFQKRG